MTYNNVIKTSFIHDSEECCQNITTSSLIHDLKEKIKIYDLFINS